MSAFSRDSGAGAVNVGLAANILLAGLKTAIGVLGHSAALLADGINSTSDVAYYVVVKILLRFAHRPPDNEHPYGHRQLESIAALVVGAFIITTAIALFWKAVNDVYDMVSSGVRVADVRAVALWVALFTAAVKTVLTFFTQRVAQRSGNPAILALAKDHRNDVLSALGAAVGISVARGGYPWADPLVGAVVAVLVLLTGIHILHDSSADLMDAVPGEALERQTRSLLANVPGVLEVEEVQAHRFGPYLVLNVTIGIDGRQSVEDGDRIASEVEKALRHGIDLVARAYVHYHPLRQPRCDQSRFCV